MREGGEAALCVLASCEAPEREGDGLTSMGAGVVLSSTAVRLGEHGTVHELAEGELFRWAYASEFDALRFTHPIALSAERCMVHLRLTNARVGMEQLVFYTALGGGLARVDRLWRTFAGKEEASPAFDAVAAALAAKSREQGTDMRFCPLFPCKSEKSGKKSKSPSEISEGLWSLWPDSNRRPAHYECAALPTEPHKQLFAAGTSLFSFTVFSVYHAFESSSIFF